jgi:transcription elongation factor GreB
VSKAFTSEETPDVPLVVPPRAPLPEGVPNYVTARGLGLLRDELARLEAERAAVDAGEGQDQRARAAIMSARVADVAARIASAQLVDPRQQAHDQARFGATVTVQATAVDGTEEERRFTIVGVDEAAPAEGRVAFLAPIARAVLGRRVGDTATLRTGRGREVLEITAIVYDHD